MSILLPTDLFPIPLLSVRSGHQDSPNGPMLARWQGCHLICSGAKVVRIWGIWVIQWRLLWYHSGQCCWWHCAEIQVNIPSSPLVPWEGCGQSRHFCARGSCCLLLKQELVQNAAQAERYSRHLLWRVFLLSYCWKGEEDKTFAVFSPYTQEINCAGNTAVFFTQFWTSFTWQKGTPA